MAFTAAERQARCRKKQKEQGQNAEAKRKDAERKRLSRRNGKAEERELPELIRKKIIEERREQTRDRVAKHRALLKEQWEQRQQNPAPFQSPQALGKEMHRAKRPLEPSLPFTPKRKNAVCRKSLDTLKANTEPSPVPLPRTRKDIAMSKETIALVQRFYEREDISRQAPGHKDTVLVRGEDGTKDRVQIRHLTSSVKEVFAMFTEEYPDIKIGKSKFASIRPVHVQLSNKLPHNVCLCKYHVNFILAINTLHAHCPNLPYYNAELPEKLICSPASKDCWFNKCETCNNGSIFLAMTDMNEAAEVTWYVWKNDSDGKLSKVMEEGTTDDLRIYIISILPQFMEHFYIVREQAVRV